MQPDQNIVKIVFCLSIDLISSTKAGLKLSTQKLDKFNIALVNQIKPHLGKLDLTDVLIKFTGDGWILMTEEPEKISALCCLATIMANRFQEEMSKNTGITIDKIPSLRLAICFGRDINVELPDQRKDWVGDSARRATRACGFCFPNEIIVDETVRGIVFRDFNIMPVDIEKRPLEYRPKKIEEEFTLYSLNELKTESASGSDAYGYFIYTLNIIGKKEEVRKVIQQVSERLENESNTQDIGEVQIQRILRSWNILMSNIPDYSIALNVLESIRNAGLNPSIYTYNTIINKAPDYETAIDWIEIMKREDIQPNRVTYSTIINKAPDFETAVDWIEIMKKEDIQPDIVTYNTIINKAPDYETAIDWIEIMKKEDIQPDIITYNTIINKAPDCEKAMDALVWMKKENIKTDFITYRIFCRFPLHDYEKVIDGLIKMKKENIEPDFFVGRIYHMLICNAPNYDTAVAWINKLSEVGIQLNIGTFNALIQKTPNFETAKFWVDRLKAEGIQPNIGTFNILINIAPDYETAKFWVDRLKAEGIQLNTGTFNLFINMAPDYETAKFWVDRLNLEGIEPNSNIYLFLLSKSPDYETAKVWMDRIIKESEMVSIEYYNTFKKIINNAPDYEVALAWTRRMYMDYGIQPDIIIYNNLIRMSPNCMEAKVWMNTMRTKGIKPNKYTYKILGQRIYNASDYETATSWIDAIRSEGITLDDKTLKILDKLKLKYNIKSS